jgi:hypothetical protein
MNGFRLQGCALKREHNECESQLLFDLWRPRCNLVLRCVIKQQFWKRLGYKY